jgi:hypothetical protein
MKGRKTGVSMAAYRLIPFNTVRSTGFFPCSRRMIKFCQYARVMMGISDTQVTMLSLAQRVIRFGYCAFPALFGLFMVIWGIFIYQGDWLLIAVGLAIFLIFGGCMYRAVSGTDS